MMSLAETQLCSMITTIDRHFARCGRPAAERALRLHLPDCPRCQAYYERHLLLAKLDPSAPSAAARIAHGLGLSTARPMRLLPPLAMAGAVGAAAFLVFSPYRDVEIGGFAARGGADAPPPSRVLVYRIAPGQAPVPAGDEISRHDELAFAYDNGAAKPYLAVFGVDEHGHVYWYHPAWQNAALMPTAIPISAAGGLNELPEAIRHPLDGTTLTVCAVFSDRSLGVNEIERLLVPPHSGSDCLDMPDAVQSKVVLRVIQ